MNTSALEFGLGSWSMQSTYARPQRHAFLYREAVQEARWAEELGFDTFSMGEHHHAYDGYCPSLLSAAAFLAASTRRIKIYPGVILLPLHRAERIAEGCAAIDAVAPNRLRLAMGLGYRDFELQAEGKRLADRRRLWMDAMNALLGELAPRIGTTELWAGGRADVALRRAAHLGLPIQYSERQKPLGEVRDTIAMYRSEFRRRPGGPAAKVMIMREIWPETDQRRIDWIKGCMIEGWLGYSGEFLKDTKSAWLSGIDASKAGAREEGAVALAGGAIIGPSSEIVDKLAPLLKLGIDGFLFRVKYDGVDSRAMRHCLERIASDVLPQLRREA